MTFACIYLSGASLTPRRACTVLEVQTLDAASDFFLFLLLVYSN